jgi:hypothetical protein
MWRAGLLMIVVGCVSTDLPGEVVAYDGHPTRFTTDGRDVYWLDSLADGTLAVYGGSLADAPLSRLDLTPLGPGGSVLAMDAANLYIGDADGVFQVNRADSSMINIASDPPTDIALATDTIVWSNEGPGDVLHWRAKNGGAVTTVSIPEAVQGVVVDGDMVYVRAYQGVYAVTRSTGSVRKLAAAGDYDSLYASEAPMVSHGLAKNGDHLDWLIHQIGEFADQDRGALIEIPVAGGAPTVVVKDLFAPALIRVDTDGTRYWLESETAHASDRQGLRRLPPGATTPVDVLMGVSTADFELVDGQLYWASSGSEYDYGYIRRMPL